MIKHLGIAVRVGQVRQEQTGLLFERFPAVRAHSQPLGEHAVARPGRVRAARAGVIEQKRVRAESGGVFRVAPAAPGEHGACFIREKGDISRLPVQKIAAFGGAPVHHAPFYAEGVILAVQARRAVGQPDKAVGIVHPAVLGSKVHERAAGRWLRTILRLPHGGKLLVGDGSAQQQRFAPVAAHRDGGKPVRRFPAAREGNFKLVELFFLVLCGKDGEKLLFRSQLDGNQQIILRDGKGEHGNDSSFGLPEEFPGKRSFPSIAVRTRRVNAVLGVRKGEKSVANCQRREKYL